MTAISGAGTAALPTTTYAPPTAATPAAATTTATSDMPCCDPAVTTPTTTAMGGGPVATTAPGVTTTGGTTLVDAGTWSMPVPGAPTAGTTTSTSATGTTGGGATTPTVPVGAPMDVGAALAMISTQLAAIATQLTQLVAAMQGTAGATQAATGAAALGGGDAVVDTSLASDDPAPSAAETAKKTAAAKAAAAKAAAAKADGGRDAKVEQVTDFAQAQKGKPYVFAKAGPDAFDCSGLTLAAWKTVGTTMPHKASEQYRLLPKVPLDQAKAGDLVFFNGADGSSSAPGHVGIVVDPAKHLMAEASTEGTPLAVVDYSKRKDLFQTVGRPEPGKSYS